MKSRRRASDSTSPACVRERERKRPAREGESGSRARLQRERKRDAARKREERNKRARSDPRYISRAAARDARACARVSSRPRLYALIPSTALILIFVFRTSSHIPLPRSTTQPCILVDSSRLLSPMPSVYSGLHAITVEQNFRFLLQLNAFPPTDLVNGMRTQFSTLYNAVEREGLQKVDDRTNSPR